MSDDDTRTGWPYARAGGAFTTGARVLVRELADITTYGGRRANFDGTIGSIRGLVAGAAVGLGVDGRASSVAGPTKLVLVDDFGQEHRFEFGAHDYVTLLD
ncbi:hypothetical protein [Mycolicibacterium palauense]|uniref:hypothetical protein n=1 Tax=Mycolicibacterium palauense TaxID=2034511 RepID=UPI000BFEE653|nr:hypothetical protein [Mycolicibacterium palauense]